MSTHRGNRPYTANGGMWIESVNASCVRVSSVFIISNDQSDWNEVGWFDAEGSPSCSYTGSGPRLLWTAVDNTVYYCATQTPPALTKGQYDNFGVRDTNADGSWEYTHSGSVFKPFTNPHFTTGFQPPMANAIALPTKLTPNSGGSSSRTALAGTIGSTQQPFLVWAGIQTTTLPGVTSLTAIRTLRW